MNTIKFDISRLVPRFLYNDKNGYAASKAIEAAFQYVADVVEEAMSILKDVEKMPEWRLDELAHEYNCLYDYTADIEVKRAWIRDAVPMFSSYGTPSAINKYLDGYFDEVEVEENWQYGGEPYHFRVNVSGEWTPENEAWARRAIAATQNVRSVLDSLRVGCKCSIGITAEGDVRARFRYPITGAQNWAGRWPQPNIEAVIDDSGKAAVEATADAWRHPYTMTGTTPEINTLGVLEQPIIPSADADVRCVIIPYIMCGQDEI